MTMNQTTMTRPEIKLVGIKARTCNKNEQNWQEGKIFPCVQRYFQEGLAERIPHRQAPGTTLCVYTEYESDVNGNYTYFIGEEVESFENVPEEFSTHTIPAQIYTKFTTQPGAMPSVLKNAWDHIWTMTPKELGADRAYIADFEVYDERAADHNNIVLDIYIGLKK